MPRLSASLAVSLALHAGVFFLLMSVSPPDLPVRQPNEYQMAIAGKEEKLVWYRFRKDLPKVRPAESATDRRPLRAETKARQQIVASAKNAPERKQIVWTPAPDLPPQPPRESPNLLALAVRLPAREFVAPVAPPPPPPRQVEIPDAPTLQQEPVKLAELPRVRRLGRRFNPPPERVPKKPAEVRMPDEAPVVDAPLPQTQLDARVKLPGRLFSAPAAKPRGPVRQVQTLDAPEVVPDAPEARLDYRVKFPGRAFSAPAAPTLALREVTVADAPSIAVVGLNPNDLAVNLPAAPSPARFAAGPEIRRNGADSSGDKTAVVVPDISVGLKAELYAAPTSSRTTREAIRLARNSGPAPVPPETDLPRSAPKSAAMKVSGAPDSRFNGRDIYMIAIQMPNLTSYSGSWLMWYADRTAKSVGLAAVSPPVAHRKVDPKYVASAAAERIEGKVQLACVIGRDGLVSNVEIVRGLDDRLNSSAAEALAKWEFFPAVSEGLPVDVDVLVEIPFHLAPRAQVPY